MFLLFSVITHIYIYIKTVQAAHMAEELVNNSYRQMKEEEVRRIAIVEAFSLAERRIQELNIKLTGTARVSRLPCMGLKSSQRVNVSNSVKLNTIYL